MFILYYINKYQMNIINQHGSYLCSLIITTIIIRPKSYVFTGCLYTAIYTLFNNTCSYNKYFVLPLMGLALVLTKHYKSRNNANDVKDVDDNYDRQYYHGDDENCNYDDYDRQHYYGNDNNGDIGSDSDSDSDSSSNDNSSNDNSSNDNSDNNSNVNNSNDNSDSDNGDYMM